MGFRLGLAQNLEVPYTKSTEVRRLEMAKSISGTVSRVYHKVGWAGIRVTERFLQTMQRHQGYVTVTEFGAKF